MHEGGQLPGRHVVGVLVEPWGRQDLARPAFAGPAPLDQPKLRPRGGEVGLRSNARRPGRVGGRERLGGCFETGRLVQPVVMDVEDNTDARSPVELEYVAHVNRRSSFSTTSRARARSDRRSNASAHRSSAAALSP